MSAASEPPAPRRRAPSRLRKLAGALLACLLAALLVVVLVSRGGGGPEHALAACLPKTPEVQKVTPQLLGGLRGAVARVLPQRVGRLYEEGTVVAENAWSDDSPLPPTVSTTERRPDAYEMRWWAPDGDDLVADVFVFADPAEAKEFMALADSPTCHAHGRTLAATRPPGGHALEWINPDAADEADVYLERGPTVYRVADAPASQRTGINPAAALGRAFATIELLACLLPSAGCTAPAAGGVPA